MLWILALACAIAGCVVLLRYASAARNEIDPTLRSIDGMRRDLQTALVRVRAETDRTRRHFDR